ncbi:MAG: FMN-dependent NADH-azoreductase [Oxalicibacterium faecigallinarum]|uniref:FMN-dependent NADH-azoreductase n=1 Tax=Oxalicibacterium faecigallinarum TaxID=573741 RepID=UPI002807E8C5|nr:FMN-dependent NADH-azoreductase [Oxalicibacterium faecigallinarum]MDQ7969198.1 FMN-dependent NADH-azoreductase [Oxalicibacterium faecigallinarum]
MSKILLINSSVRRTDSISRKVTGEFVAKWQARNPGTIVVERDVAAQPLPHLTEQTLGAFFTPADQRTAEQAEIAKLSESLVQELFDADVIVIGAPMYNFSITSGLKAWIDHVARAGVTFKYGESGPVGLLTGKKVYIFTATGGVYSSGPAQSMDFLGTYLRTVLGFIGLTDITFVHSEGLAMGEAGVEKALAQTSETINELLPA